MIAASVVLASSLADTPALDDALIAAVNNRPGMGWTAHRSPRFEGLSLDEAKALLGALELPAGAEKWVQPRVEQAAPVRAGRSPTDFDCRTQWPKCVFPVRDQGSCGGCWAFAASEVLSDRFCIASNAESKAGVLSPQDLISCDVGKYTFGCEGGVPEYAWKYLTATGISTDACEPFIGNNTEVCPLACDASAPAGTSFTKYKAVDGSVRMLTSSQGAIQQAMVGGPGQGPGGPVQAGFYVYQDFFAYKSGIYSCPTNGSVPLGRHSVKVVGYGVEKANASAVPVDYWVVANSWGPSWGDNGHFKIVAGKNTCQIDVRVLARLARPVGSALGALLPMPPRLAVRTRVPARVRTCARADRCTHAHPHLLLLPTPSPGCSAHAARCYRRR